MSEIAIAQILQFIHNVQITDKLFKIRLNQSITHTQILIFNIRGHVAY